MSQEIGMTLEQHQRNLVEECKRFRTTARMAPGAKTCEEEVAGRLGLEIKPSTPIGKLLSGQLDRPALVKLGIGVVTIYILIKLLKS